MCRCNFPLGTFLKTRFINDICLSSVGIYMLSLSSRVTKELCIFSEE